MPGDRAALAHSAGKPLLMEEYGAQKQYITPRDALIHRCLQMLLSCTSMVCTPAYDTVDVNDHEPLHVCMLRSLAGAAAAHRVAGTLVRDSKHGTK